MSDDVTISITIAADPVTADLLRDLLALLASVEILDEPES